MVVQKAKWGATMWSQTNKAVGTCGPCMYTHMFLINDDCQICKRPKSRRQIEKKQLFKFKLFN
jgi:hypothetical protein